MVYYEGVSGEALIINDLVQLLRNRHEFRQTNAKNFAEFKNDAKNDTFKKINALLKLPDEEIVRRLTSKTTTDFVKETREMCAYINETFVGEKKWQTQALEKLPLFTPVELEELAKKMARKVMDEKAANSLTGRFSFRARRFLKTRNTKEEKELARNIRDDLLTIVERQMQIRQEERINPTANVENPGQSLDILTETAHQHQADSSQEITKAKLNKIRAEQSHDER